MKENVINDLVLQFEIAGIIKTEKIQETKLLIDMYLGNYTLIKEESRTSLSTQIDCTEEYLRQYLIQMKLDGCTDASIANYKNNLQNMLAYINKGIFEISYSDLKGYLAYGKLFRKWKDRTYNSKLICMRSFFGWLYEEDMLPNNPAKKLKETKVERRIGPTLKAEQREEVRCACKNEMELALCDLLYSSGIRVSELCRLNINDVDFSNMKAIVYGKGRKEREVYFNGQAKVHLERYLKNRTDNNLALFVTNQKPHNRISSSTVRNILKRIKNRDVDLATVKLTPHVFRRTVGTDMINKGAILNYAVKHYKLPSNPCRAAGVIGKSRAEKMNIWTKEQFESFIPLVNKSAMKLAFDILFYTGIRSGELLALTPQDILPEKRINICKNYAVVNGVEMFLVPKTPRSKRCIAIPDFLYDALQEYMSRLYECEPDKRIFYFTKHALEKEIKRKAEVADLPIIRVHDLRHSHASLLIEMGFDILEVSERLGHESVQTTWDTYSHLYPDKDKKLASELNKLRRKNC